MSIHVSVLASLLNVVLWGGAAVNVKMRRRTDTGSADSWEMSVSLSSSVTNDRSSCSWPPGKLARRLQHANAMLTWPLLHIKLPLSHSRLELRCLQPAVLLASPFSYMVERVFAFACFRVGKITEPDVHYLPQNKETYGNTSSCVKVSKCKYCVHLLNYWMLCFSRTNQISWFSVNSCSKYTIKSEKLSA